MPHSQDGSLCANNFTRSHKPRSLYTPWFFLTLSDGASHFMSWPLWIQLSAETLCQIWLLDWRIPRLTYMQAKWTPWGSSSATARATWTNLGAYMSVCGLITMESSQGYHKGLSNEVKTSLLYQSQVAQQVHHEVVDWIWNSLHRKSGQGGGCLSRARPHSLARDKIANKKQSQHCQYMQEKKGEGGVHPVQT